MSYFRRLALHRSVKQSQSTAWERLFSKPTRTVTYDLHVDDLLWIIVRCLR